MSGCRPTGADSCRGKAARAPGDRAKPGPDRSTPAPTPGSASPPVRVVRVGNRRPDRSPVVAHRPPTGPRLAVPHHGGPVPRVTTCTGRLEPDHPAPDPGTGRRRDNRDVLPPPGALGATARSSNQGRRGLALAWTPTQTFETAPRVGGSGVAATILALRDQAVALNATPATPSRQFRWSTVLLLTALLLVFGAGRIGTS
jgi:hypothetical protein